MKSVELSDEAYDRLQRLAAARQLAPAEVLAALLTAEAAAPDAPLCDALRTGEIARAADAAGRYLGLLAWVARHHAADFTDFIAHQDSARRYLLLSRAEVNAIRQQHCSRQIDGTQYWAVMNLAPATQTAFIRRLLEFIGCHDATVTEALRVLDLEQSHPPRRPELVDVT